MEFDLLEYLSEFTRYELIDTYYLARSSLISDVTIFMSTLFAYVTVAYFVSAKMTKFQAITVSSLYSLFALYMTSSAYNSSLMASSIAYAITGHNPSKDSIILVTILIIAWVSSIILFIQAHRLKEA